MESYYMGHRVEYADLIPKTVRRVPVEGNPRNWPGWSRRLIVGLDARGYSIDEINPDDYRHYFKAGISPAEAINERMRINPDGT